MMHRFLAMMMVAAGLLLACPAVQAADYRQMSTAQLAAMRERMQEAPPEEQRAFQEEWQRRVRMMTTAERRQYLEPSPEPGLRSRGQGEERRLDEVPPAYGGDADGGRPPALERGRDRLIAPPASVAPRRFGEDDAWQERRRQAGPRRFAPTPSFGGGSPFDFGRRPSGAEDARSRRR